MTKKTGLTELFFVFCFSVDFNFIDANDILDFQKYLMTRTWYKSVWVN